MVGMWEDMGGCEGILGSGGYFFIVIQNISYAAYFILKPHACSALYLTPRNCHGLTYLTVVKELTLLLILLFPFTPPLKGNSKTD